MTEEQQQTEIFALRIMNLTTRENSKAKEMLMTVYNNASEWDTGKSHRWVGYAQCLLVAEGTVTLEEMHNITDTFYRAKRG